MAANFRIHDPYVLAILPRPLDRNASYPVSEVLGLRHNSARRKRAELAVGIDGEAANIYDVSTGRLLTSSPISPQESFTCPPCSLRLRFQDSQDVARYTYVSTQSSTTYTITLFKDLVDASGRTISTKASSDTRFESPTLYLAAEPSFSSDGASKSVLIAVCKNGDIICLDGESLVELWRESVSHVVRDLSSSSSGCRIQYATSIPATIARKGILNSKDETFAPFKQVSSALDPDYLVLVVKTNDRRKEASHVLVLGILPKDSTDSATKHLVQLYHAPLSNSSSTAGPDLRYQVDAESGQLFELSDDALTVYELGGSVIRPRHSLSTPSVVSFLQLSRRSVITSTPKSLQVVNLQFQSVSAAAPMNLTDWQSGDESDKNLPDCILVSYFKRLDMLVARVNNTLISVQLEPPSTRGKRRRAEGMLIDSIGRGISQTGQSPKKRRSGPSAFGDFLPGTLTSKSAAELATHMEQADKLLEQGDFVRFEALFADKVGMNIDSVQKKPKSVAKSVGDDAADTPEWIWLKKRKQYPKVDRRWVLYAISRVFSLERADQEDSAPHLRMDLPSSNLLIYLVVAGHLSLSNIRAAFRGQLLRSQGLADLDTQLVTDLLESFVQLDPTLDLLRTYLSATRLGERELLITIRIILRDLDVIQDANHEVKLLADKPYDGGAEDGDGDVAMQLDQLEQQLEILEDQLGNGSSSQARCLTLAFAMLAEHPAVSTVREMRLVLKPQDVVALICVLRMELVRGAWTTRYLDPTTLGDDGSLDSPPDGTLLLIANLIARCLDSLGPGGWLQSDMASYGGTGDVSSLLTALRLEVNAALEGTEEAVRLNSLLSETLLYSRAALMAEALSAGPSANPAIHQMRLEGLESQRLPLGLRVAQLPSTKKVQVSGEVTLRAPREKGLLISQKVGEYTLERISI